MTNTVTDIDKEIADLQAKKAQLIETSRNQTIADIKVLISQYSLTASELGLNKKTNTKGSKTKAKAKFKNPADQSQTWSGRGIQPKWVKEYIKSGKTLDSLLIK